MKMKSDKNKRMRAYISRIDKKETRRFFEVKLFIFILVWILIFAIFEIKNRNSKWINGNAIREKNDTNNDKN